MTLEMDDATRELLERAAIDGLGVLQMPDYSTWTKEQIAGTADSALKLAQQNAERLKALELHLSGINHDRKFNPETYKWLMSTPL